MIEAKKLIKTHKENGEFMFWDYLSRLDYINEAVKQFNKLGQTSINIQMHRISYPTYLKVCEKLQKKGYKVDCKYSHITNEADITISWQPHEKGVDNG